MRLFKIGVMVAVALTLLVVLPLRSPGKDAAGRALEHGGMGTDPATAVLDFSELRV